MRTVFSKSLSCAALFFATTFALHFSTANAVDVNSGDLILKYTASVSGSSHGNLTLYYTGTGTSGTSGVSISMLDILTLGDGNEPFGSAMPSGIPNVTTGQGALNGDAAVIPGSPDLTTLNNSGSGINGLYSEIYAAETNPASSWITLTKATPGTTDTIDFGNVVAAGLSQANINSIFITDSFTFASNNFGNFGYQLAGDSTLYIGAVQLQAVPEPSTYAMLATALVGSSTYYVRRRSTKSLSK